MASDIIKKTMSGNSKKNYAESQENLHPAVRRMEGEGYEAWAAFLKFLAGTGRERDFGELAKKTNLTAGTLKIYSGKFQWHERCAIQDAENFLFAQRLLREKLAEQALDCSKEAAELKKTGIAISKQMLEKATNYLKDLPDSATKKISITDIVKLAKEGVQIGRLSLDMPTEIIETVTADEISQMSESELRDFLAQRNIRGHLEAGESERDYIDIVPENYD